MFHDIFINEIGPGLEVKKTGKFQTCFICVLLAMYVLVTAIASGIADKLADFREKIAK